MLQKYYIYVTFVLNLVIYIDIFTKNDKILNELWLYLKFVETKEKNTSIICYILQNIIMVQKNPEFDSKNE